MSVSTSCGRAVAALALIVFVASGESRVVSGLISILATLLFSFRNVGESVWAGTLVVWSLAVSKKTGWGGLLRS